MPYEAQCAELARCSVGHHGELREVVFLSGNKDYLLVFADGTVLAPSDDRSLKREYETCAGYGEIAQQLGGTQPYSLLAFGYQGTGPGCFATFLKTAGFNVGESDIVQMSPPVRLRADGSRVSGHAGDGGRIRWEDQSDTPIVKDPAAAAAPPPATPVSEAAGPPPVQATKVEDQHREPTHAPAADWYKDPAGRHQYRYWDGASWTHQVADAGRQSIDPLVAIPGATTSAYVQQPQQPSPGRGVVRIIMGVVLILLFFTGFFGNPPDTLSYALGGGVLFAVPGALLILWGWYVPSLRKPLTGPAVATPTQPVPYVAAQAPAAPPRAAAPQPAASQVGVEFDENGRANVTLQQHGQWTLKREGTYTYYSRPAASLLEATEILRRTEWIPGLTYYTVDTPDGSLGCDMNGYYTEAPLKTKNLRLAAPPAVSGTVEFSSLKMFGDGFQNQSVVASLKQAGKYARLVLLMECGRCGYQSPVETQAGSLVRECYCCGANNTGSRGSVSVIVSGGRTVEI